MSQAQPNTMPSQEPTTLSRRERARRRVYAQQAAVNQRQDTHNLDKEQEMQEHRPPEAPEPEEAPQVEPEGTDKDQEMQEHHPPEAPQPEEAKQAQSEILDPNLVPLDTDLLMRLIAAFTKTLTEAMVTGMHAGTRLSHLSYEEIEAQGVPYQDYVTGAYREIMKEHKDRCKSRSPPSTPPPAEICTRQVGPPKMPNQGLPQLAIMQLPRVVKMPPFFGKPNEKVVPWLYRIGRARQEFNWSDQDTITCALHSAEGTAADWTIDVTRDHPDISWEQLKRAAIKRFGPPPGELRRYAAEWQSRKQQEDEDVDLYIKEMLEISSRLGRRVEESEKIAVILNGVEFYLRKAVGPMLFDNIEDCHEALVRHAQCHAALKQAKRDAIRSAKQELSEASTNSASWTGPQNQPETSMRPNVKEKPPNPSVAETIQKAASPSPVKDICCYNCNKPSHLRVQCPELFKLRAITNREHYNITPRRGMEKWPPILTEDVTAGQKNNNQGN
jgi:hypothetical protein